jgi:hypothetical protein
MGAPPDLAPAPPDLTPPPRGPYPTGATGLNVGDTLYDIMAMGYNLSLQQTDSTMLMYQTIALDELHSNTACKCILLNESAEWCQPCNAEQAITVDYVNTHPGLCVFDVLIDGYKPGVRATKADVDNWTQMYAQNYPVVGANIQTYIHLPHPDALPTNVVIDPVSMKILQINAGVDLNNPNQFFSDAMALCASAQP